MTYKRFKLNYAHKLKLCSELSLFCSCKRRDNIIVGVRIVITIINKQNAHINHQTNKTNFIGVISKLLTMRTAKTLHQKTLIQPAITDYEQRDNIGRLFRPLYAIKMLQLCCDTNENKALAINIGIYGLQFQLDNYSI